MCVSSQYKIEVLFVSHHSSAIYSFHHLRIINDSCLYNYISYIYVYICINVLYYTFIHVFIHFNVAFRDCHYRIISTLRGKLICHPGPTPPIIIFTLFLHYSNTPLLHYSTTPILYYCTTALLQNVM